MQQRRTYPVVVNFRAEADQLARLDWLADHLEISTAALLRALVDGVSSIDGVELRRTLARLSMADPRHLDQVEVVIDPKFADQLDSASRDAANA